MYCKVWYLSSYSLAILIYNKTRNAFVIVKQFRPGTYVHRPSDLPAISDISLFQLYT